MVEGLPLVGLPPLRLSRSSLLLKRMLDLVVASVALIVLLPVLVAVAVAVKLSSAGPVLYMNECVGRNGHRFRAIKFRTMRPDASDLLDALLSSDALIREQFDRTLKLPRDPRVTPLGTLLRRSSLDELPQLFNVLRGDMSLVGARAINTFEYDRYFGANDQEYGPVPPYWEYDLRPGLTGYWQINGRSSIDYADRLRLDATYVANWSMRLDLEILAKTARVLVARRGAT